MKIVVIGAGAIGSVIAGYLCHANYHVQLICKHREILESIENNGLRIEGIHDPIICYPEVVLDISQMVEQPDIIFLATRANEVAELAQHLVPFLRDDTAMITLQQGMCEPIVADIVRPDRTIGCVIGWTATLLGPGRVAITSEADFVVGELDGEVTHRLLIIKSLLEKIFPVTISSNIYGARFSNLILNASLNTLAGICGLLWGELLRNNLARAIALLAITEGVTVANHLKIQLEPTANNIHLQKLVLNATEGAARLRFALFTKHLRLQLLGLKYQRVKSSSLQFLHRGKTTEIDYMNGYLVNKAQQYHLSLPVHQKLISLTKQIESGKLGISPANLVHIMAPDRSNSS